MRTQRPKGYAQPDMWVIAIFVVLASITGVYVVSSNVRSMPVAEIRGQDLAANMAIYRTAVVRFAQDNPTFNGTVPDASLPLAAWYRQVRNPLWTNQISDGKVTVYATSATPVPIAGDLAALSHHSLLAGWKRQDTGTLWTPGFGDTGIELAAAIPDGSPVWVAILR